MEAATRERKRARQGRGKSETKRPRQDERERDKRGVRGGDEEGKSGTRVHPPTGNCGLTPGLLDINSGKQDTPYLLKQTTPSEKASK